MFTTVVLIVVAIIFTIWLAGTLISAVEGDNGWAVMFWGIIILLVVGRVLGT